MTIKKSFYLRALSLVVAFILTFITVMVFPADVFAYHSDETGHYLDASDVIVGSVYLRDADGNPKNAENKPLDPGSNTTIEKGDKLLFVFNWNLSISEDEFTDLINKPLYFDLSTITNLHIPKAKISSATDDNNNETCLYEIDEDNRLVITIKEGNHNQSGSCYIFGELDLTDLSDKNAGSYDVWFQDASSEVHYYFNLSNIMPKLTIEKNFDESASAGKDTIDNKNAIYKGNDGAYYISYVVTVKCTDGDMKDVKLSEYFGSGHGEVTSLTVTNKKTGKSETKSFDADDELFIGNMSDGDEFEVKYTVKLTGTDENAIIEQGYYSNQAKASGTTKHKNTVESNYAHIDTTTGQPYISKNGSLSEDKTSIDWTITIGLGSLEPNTTITIKDLFDNKKSVYTEEFVKIFGDSGAEISFDDFQRIMSEYNDPNNSPYVTYDDAKKEYVIKYNTKIKETVLEGPRTTISNTASVKFGDGNWKKSTGSVKTHKDIGSLDVQKSHVVSDKGDRITWTVSFNIPEYDDGSITILKIDDPDANIAPDSAYYDPNMFYFYILNDNGAKIDVSQYINTLSSDTSNNHYWWVNFDNSSGIFDQYKGKRLYVEYTLKTDDGSKITSANNIAKVEVQYDDGTYLESYDTDRFKSFAQKTSSQSGSGGLYPITWTISVTSENGFKKGQVITIEDTIPEGYKLIGNVSTYYYRLDWGATADNATWAYDLSSDKISNEGNKYTFTYDLSYFNGWDDPNYFDNPNMGYAIKYTTVMDEDTEFGKLLALRQKDYTNEAVVTVDDQSEKVNATETITLPDEAIVTKNYEIKEIKRPEGDTNADQRVENVTVEYTIDINPESIDLIPEVENGKITVKDELGYKLSLAEDKPEPVKIYEVDKTDPNIKRQIDTAGKYELSDDGKTITFTLNDNVHYEIHYIVNAAPCGADEDKIKTEAWYSNTVSIIAEGKYYSDTSTIAEWGNFISGSSYTHTTMALEIDVIKLWEGDEKIGTAARSGYQIVLYQVTDNDVDHAQVFTYPDGSGYRNPQPLTGEEGQKIEFPSLPINDGSTSVTYTYYIVEERINGVESDYDCKIEPVTTGSTSESNGKTIVSKDVTLKLTNTYNKTIEPEKISVKVTKGWDGGDAANRPAVTFELQTANGTHVAVDNGYQNPVTLTATDSNNWTYTWGNLPRGNYKVVETGNVAGYEVSGADYFDVLAENDDDVTYSGTITNKFIETTPDKISITINKGWEGNSTARPDVTFELRQNGTKVNVGTGYQNPVTLKANDGKNWKYTWGNLPRGNYEVVETKVDGYYKAVSSSVSVKAAGDIAPSYDVTITNAYETVNVTLNKTWVHDGNNATTKPKTSDLTFTVTGTVGNEEVYKVEGVTFSDAEITPANGKDTVTFKNLPKYYNGQTITYKVTESGYTSYTPSPSDTVTADDKYECAITNTYNKTPEKKISIKVSKTWAGDNKAKDDHDAITVKLNRKDASNNPVRTAELSKTKGWSVTWDNLDGSASEYTVEEELPANYAGVYTKSIGDIKPVGSSTTEYTCDITNTYQPKVKTITVNKVWYDNTNAAKMRPANIKIQLYRDGAPYGEPKEFSGTVSPWTKKWENLSVDDGNGNEYVYTVEEVPVANYDSEVKYSTDGKTITVSNTYKSKIVSVQKKWSGDSKVKDSRPTVEIQLYRDGTEYGEPKELTEEGDWYCEWLNLPFEHLENGVMTEYVYTIDEINVGSDYTCSTTSETRAQNNKLRENETKYTVTNTYHPKAKKVVTVNKDWVGDEGLGIRPSEVSVKLSGTNGTEETQVLNEENSWSYTWSDLVAADSDGNEIKYTVEEIDVDANYTSRPDFTEDGNTINYFITNECNIKTELEPDETEISVSKVWVDNGNAKGKRYPITVELSTTDSEGNTVTETAVLSEINHWAKTWSHLKKYDDNVQYTYSVRELPSDNANSEYYVSSTKQSTTSNGGTHYTITNTYKDQTVSVQKEWDDKNNADGKRPSEITVQLKQNGTSYGEAKKLNSGNKWYEEWPDLPYEHLVNGGMVKYDYTVEEITVAEYETSYEPPSFDANTNETGYVITNTYTPKPKKTITITKLWDDNEDKAGVRPGSIEVELVRDSDGEVVGTGTLNDENEWYCEWSVDLYEDDGVTVRNYTAKETGKIPNYKPSSDKTKESSTKTNFVITNTYAPAKIMLSKKDLDTGEEIPGAKIVITDDSTGKEVVKWTSGKSENTFELPAGDYTLTEEVAPDGYEKIKTSIKFTVSDDGKVDVMDTVSTQNPDGVTTIIINDAPIKFELIKTYADDELKTMDSGERDKLLKATKFKLTDKTAGKTFPEASPEWDSENERAVVTFKGPDLKAGHTYELKETKAPDGYTVSSNVYVCEIASDGTVTYKCNGKSVDFLECVNTSMESNSSDTGTPSETPSDSGTPSGITDYPVITPVAPGSKPYGEDVSSGAEVYEESDIFGGSRFKAAMIISSLMVVVVAFAESFIIRIWKKRRSMKR